MPRYRFVVGGQVQGVGYRWFAAKHAELLKLTGFARNLADGGVEVEAQGDEAALATYAERLKEGPRSASVATISKESVASLPGEREFRTF